MKISWKLVVVTALALMLMMGTAVANETVTSGYGRNQSEGTGTGLRVVWNFITDFLNLEEAELRAERRDGKTIVEIAEAKGVNEETLVGEVVNFHTERIETSLAEGTMTEEQAEECLDGMEERIETNMNKAPTPKRHMMNRQEHMKAERGGRFAEQQ